MVIRCPGCGWRLGLRQSLAHDGHADVQHLGDVVGLQATGSQATHLSGDRRRVGRPMRSARAR